MWETAGSRGGDFIIRLQVAQESRTDGGSIKKVSDCTAFSDTAEGIIPSEALWAVMTPREGEIGVKIQADHAPCCADGIIM